MSTKYENTFHKTTTDRLLYDNQSTEQHISLRNINYYRFNGTNRIKFGIEIKHVINSYDSFRDAYHDWFGNLVPELLVDKDISENKFGSFFNYIFEPFNRLETTLGVRFDQFSYNSNSHISPRLSFSYKLTEKTSLTGSAGVYYQNLPLALLALDENYRNLKDPLAYHCVLGFNHLLSENTRLTLEVYDKEYHDFPLDPTLPSLFPADEAGRQDRLVSGGRAYSRGIEMVVQKKLAKDFYGLVSGSVFRTKYRDYDGIWRDRVSCNRYLFNIEGGYIASEKWEFSMRWVFAGGRPYTPFDIEASEALNSGIFDRQMINSVRYPSYHSMNFRMDRRYNFRKSNMILYLDLWNTYKRKNISSYYWNEVERKTDRVNQWGFIPVFGLEWEF